MIMRAVIANVPNQPFRVAEGSSTPVMKSAAEWLCQWRFGSMDSGSLSVANRLVQTSRHAICVGPAAQVTAEAGGSPGRSGNRPPASPPALSVKLIVPDATAALTWYATALGATELGHLGGVAGLELDGAPFFLHEVHGGSCMHADQGTLPNHSSGRLLALAISLARHMQRFETNKAARGHVIIFGSLQLPCPWRRIRFTLDRLMRYRSARTGRGVPVRKLSTIASIWSCPSRSAIRPPVWSAFPEMMTASRRQSVSGSAAGSAAVCVPFLRASM
jgi:hypothetical protein